MTVERSLIIPMFDEATRIEASLRELAASPLNDPDTEILLVDDSPLDAELAMRGLEEAVRVALRTRRFSAS